MSKRRMSEDDYDPALMDCGIFKLTRSNQGEFGARHDPQTAIQRRLMNQPAMESQPIMNPTLLNTPPAPPPSEDQSLGWVYRSSSVRYFNGEPTSFEMNLPHPAAVIHFDENELRARIERGLMVGEIPIWNVMHAVCGDRVRRLLPGVYQYVSVDDLVTAFEAVSTYLPDTRPSAQVYGPLAVVVWVDTMLQSAAPQMFFHF